MGVEDKKALRRITLWVEYATSLGIEGKGAYDKSTILSYFNQSQRETIDISMYHASVQHRDQYSIYLTRPCLLLLRSQSHDTWSLNHTPRHHLAPIDMLQHRITGSKGGSEALFGGNPSKPVRDPDRHA
jgi:hypothetical protein